MDNESFGVSMCGQPFVLKKIGEEITVELFYKDNRLYGGLDKALQQSHEISDKDLWTLLIKKSKEDGNLNWNFDHFKCELSLCQKLNLDDTSVVQWALFRLEKQKLSILDTVSHINRYIEAALDTKIKLKSKDLEIKALMDQVSELKAALVEYESKASNLEATMFSHFTEILNSKKRKIRHLNSLVGQANDPTNSSAG